MLKLEKGSSTSERAFFTYLFCHQATNLFRHVHECLDFSIDHCIEIINRWGQCLPMLLRRRGGDSCLFYGAIVRWTLELASLSSVRRCYCVTRVRYHVLKARGGGLEPAAACQQRFLGANPAQETILPLDEGCERIHLIRHDGNEKKESRTEKTVDVCDAVGSQNELQILASWTSINHALPSLSRDYQDSGCGPGRCAHESRRLHLETLLNPALLYYH